MWRRLIYHPEVNYALRQTLVLCLPVAVGWLLGNLQNGLLFSLVPACCNIAGLDTPHKRFFKRLLIGGGLFAFSSFLVQYLGAYAVPLPIFLFSMALRVGVTGEFGPRAGSVQPAARQTAARRADCRHLYPEPGRSDAHLAAAVALYPGHGLVRPL